MEAETTEAHSFVRRSGKGQLSIYIIKAGGGNIIIGLDNCV